MAGNKEFVMPSDGEKLEFVMPTDGEVLQTETSPKQSAPSQGAESGLSNFIQAPKTSGLSDYTGKPISTFTSPSASTSSVGGNKITKAEQLLRKQYEAEGEEFDSYKKMSFDEYKSSVKKWNDDIDLTNYDNLKKLFIGDGSNPPLGNRYQEVVDFEKKLSTTSTSPLASTSSVGVEKIEVPKVVPNDIRAYEYSQSKLRDQDKKIQKLKGLHNDIDMGDNPNALVVQNQYNQELEKSQQERFALSKSASIAQEKVNASLNNIVNSIDKNKGWNKFIGTDNDGFENANIEAIDTYSRKVAKDSGAPETGYFQTLVKNKIKATAEYKIIEPDVNAQFEKLHKEKFGKTPSEYLGDDFAKAFKEGEKINKATSLELGAVQRELFTKAKEESTPINDGYKTFSESLNVTYTQTQNDIQQKVVQLNDAYKSGKINQETYSSQFKSLEDKFKEVNDSYSKQIDESKKSYLDELNKINNKYNVQFKRQQSEIVKIANEQLKAEADKFSKAYKPNPKYVKETQELYSKAFENVSNATQKAKNIMDSYKGGGVRWVEGYVGTLGNSINGIATSLNMPNVALFGETLANEYKVGDSEIKSLKDLLNVNKMINSTSALAGGMTPSMLAAIPTGGASVALGAGALTAAAVSGLASWGVETMDMAGNTYNDILAQTGSVASAKEASDQVVQSQVVLMPTYAIEMLPFIHGGLSKIKSKLGKVAAGAAIEYGSEYMQEFPQNIFEQNIRAGRDFNDLKVLTQDFTDFTKVAEQAKSTALNLLPMIGMGVMGGLNQSDEKNEIAKKKINAIASSEILQQRFNKFNPYQFNQYIQGIYMAHGENFVQALAEASFANGTIDKEVYGKILEQKEKTKELVETSKSLGLPVSDSKLYNMLMSQFDEQMAKANNIEDVNAKAILIEKAKKYNQQAIDVLNLQEVPHVIVKYGNGIEMVWTQEQVENAMSDDAFIGNLLNENIDIKLFNTESGFSDKLNEKVSDYAKREIKSQEEFSKPIKYTSPTNDLYGYVEENGVKRDLTKEEFEDYGKVDMEQQVAATTTEEPQGVGEGTQEINQENIDKINYTLRDNENNVLVRLPLSSIETGVPKGNIFAEQRKSAAQAHLEGAVSGHDKENTATQASLNKDGNLFIADGRHRVEAQKDSGVEYGWFEVPKDQAKEIESKYEATKNKEAIIPSEESAMGKDIVQGEQQEVEMVASTTEKVLDVKNARPIEETHVANINSGEVVIGYHATLNGNVDTGKELGIHIGTKQVAETIKNGRNNNNGDVKQVAFRVQKPLILGDMAKWNSIDILGELYRQKLIPIQTLKEIKDSDISEKEKQKQIIDIIKQKGYDSIAYQNNNEGNGEYSYILFDKSQLSETPIKQESQTNNKENAIQEQSAGKVLQREQGKVGEAGDESQGRKSSEQLQEEIDDLRAKEQADLAKAIPNIKDYLESGTYGEEQGNMPDDLYAIYKPIYDSYNKQITLLLREQKALEQLLTKGEESLQNKNLGLQNEKSKQGSGTSEAKVNSEEVQYNGQDAIGARSRPKSEQNASRNEAKEKVANPEKNAALKAANSYNESVGLPEVTPHEYKPSDKELQSKIAELYSKLQDVTSEDYQETETEREIFEGYKKKFPEIIDQYQIKNYKELVEKSYAQLISEVNKQFEALPVKVSFHEGDKNYENSAELLDDVHNFNHLWVYKGGDDHSTLGSKTKDKNGITANDKFRAVHDYYGHAVEGYQFGRDGEENAWIEHSKMFSPLAQWALTAETRGQNSFVNYSGVNDVALEKIKLGSALKREGLKQGNNEMVSEGQKLLDEANAEFQFAEQKPILLPTEFTSISDYHDVNIDKIPKKLVSTKATKPTEKAQEGKADLSLFKDVADKLYSLKKEPLTAKEKEVIKQEVVNKPLEVRQSIDKAKKLMDELEKKGLIKTIKCK
jgi:hypothetical protein